MSDATAVTTTTIEAEIRIAAPPSVVWHAITEGVGDWWPHRFRDEGSSVHIEPRIGGRFYEQFDDSGAGALYATVTYLEPERILKVSGSMGLAGAAIYVKTYRLAAIDGGTLVQTSSAMLGGIDSQTRDGYRTGNQEVLRALAAYLEGNADGPAASRPDPAVSLR